MTLKVSTMRNQRVTRSGSDISGPEDRLLITFRIPVFATILFVITMLSIYLLAGSVVGYYADPGSPFQRVELNN